MKDVKPAGQTAGDDRIFNQGAKDGEWEKGSTKQAKRGKVSIENPAGGWPYQPNS